MNGLALYFGRFQIFHNGHLDVLRYIDGIDDVGEIVIVVGSTQYDFCTRAPGWPWANNPFTWSERQEMILRSLDGQLRKPWRVCGVPDTHEHESWYRSMRTVSGPFTICYSCDPNERAFFAARGVDARDFPRRYAFHAGSLRRRILDGVDHRPFVPDGSALVMERVGVRERLESLYQLDRARDRAGDR
jgi:nicotinamide-nucleotide adenylyltransferase